MESRLPPGPQSWMMFTESLTPPDAESDALAATVMSAVELVASSVLSPVLRSFSQETRVDASYGMGDDGAGFNG